MDRITTIIAAFNREHLIAETLRSVLCQTRPPHEIIVVDDGSTDGTADVVRSFGNDVLLIQQTNQGAGAARNRGLARASGDFIHFMDSDDLSSLNTYQCQLRALKASGADVAYGPWVKTRLDNCECRTQAVVIQQAPLPAVPPMHEWVLRGWVTVFQPCLFRRTLLVKAGLYREDLKPSEDTEYLYRIGKAGAKLVHTPETLLVYRIHQGQVSTAQQTERQHDWLRFLSAMDSHCEKDATLSAETKRLVSVRKLNSLRSIPSSLAPEIRDDLLSRIPIATGFLHALTYPWQSATARLRHRLFGDCYDVAFGPKALGDSHKLLIRQLGYTHAGVYRDA